MAAVLWGSGISFGGVLAFLYADLIVLPLPLLDAYRRYFGPEDGGLLQGLFFYLTMVATGIIMNVFFSMFSLIPQSELEYPGRNDPF